MLKLIMLLTACFSICIVFTSITGTPPQIEKPYQYALGQFKVFALLDGYVDLHLQNIIKDSSTFDHPYFHCVNPYEKIHIPVNVYLIDTNKQIILVDVGLGGHDNSTTGFLIQSLHHLGYKPNQITDILITHLHTDHIAGLLTKDGKKAFEKAKVHISQKDLSYWAHEQQIYPELKPFFQNLFKPYEIIPFSPNQKLFDGVTVCSTPGHSPGHSSFLFESDHQKMLIWGDIIHVYELQFAHPEISLNFDSHRHEAIETRKALLRHVFKESILVGGAHLPFPGLGFVLKNSHDDTQENYCWKSL